MASRPPFRASVPKNPVEITLDGKVLVAEEGEPVAAALVAAGAIGLARSPKFHRPRGPACMRGACDGCLMRVDGAPNVMTCLAPARAGTVVASQNTLGSRKLDLLRMTDWFFPDGMNHHELFAGVPGVQNVMQAFARRVAGLGRVPEAVRAPRTAVRRSLDVLIVGGGPAGLAAATAFHKKGRRVEVVDDGLVAGGSLRGLSDVAAVKELWALIAPALTGNVTVRTSTVAAAVYGDGVLVVGPAVTELLEARTLVLAPGAHDGVIPFDGNDLPGIYSARAALQLLGQGVAVGGRVTVAIAPGGGPFGEIFADEVRRRELPMEVELVRGLPRSAAGSSRAKEVSFEGAPKPHKVDALLVDAVRAPAYELCAQAGALLEHAPSGFVVRTNAGGRIAEGVWALGEVTGAPLDAERIRCDVAALVETA